MPVKNHEMIPLEELEVGQAYTLHARNLAIGIWDGKKFHGIRRKFGSAFIEEEIHYDLDERHGTAVALRKLQQSPVDGYRKEEALAHLDLARAALKVGESHKALVEFDEALPVLLKLLEVKK